MWLEFLGEFASSSAGSGCFLLVLVFLVVHLLHSVLGVGLGILGRIGQFSLGELEVALTLTVTLFSPSVHLPRCRPQAAACSDSSRQPPARSVTADRLFVQVRRAPQTRSTPQ